MTTTVLPRSPAGTLGFLAGALAIVLLLVQFWAGPFAPQQRASVTIGEIAAEIKQSAKRAILGQKRPEPVARPWDADRIAKLVAAVLAGIAVVLGLFGFVRREDWRMSSSAVALGVSAVVLQFFIWAFAVAISAVVLIVIISNLDGFPG